MFIFSWRKYPDWASVGLAGERSTGSGGSKIFPIPYSYFQETVSVCEVVILLIARVQVFVLQRLVPGHLFELHEGFPISPGSCQTQANESESSQTRLHVQRLQPQHIRD